MSNAEKVKTALSRIEEGLATINTNEDWKAYLRFQSQFYHYSYGNAILIYLQSGGKATYVKGYKAWNKLGRYVKKGSRGLAILAPCVRKIEVFKEPDNKVVYQDAEGEKETKQVLSGFRIAYVYDIADTEGDDSLLPVLVRGLAGNTDSEKEIYDRLLAVISKEFIVQEVVGIASKGSYNTETGIIAVRSDLEYLQRIKTLLHETAHAYDFSMHPDETIPRNRRELIAESCAFVVSMRLGLDTSSYSMSYIQSWLKDKAELKIIADAVQKISCRIINMLAESQDSAFIHLSESEDTI